MIKEILVIIRFNTPGRILRKQTKTGSDILGVKTFFVSFALTVRYLSIICVPLYHVSLKLQIILKVYCINLDDGLDRS